MDDTLCHNFGGKTCDVRNAIFHCYSNIFNWFNSVNHLVMLAHVCMRAHAHCAVCVLRGAIVILAAQRKIYIHFRWSDQNAFFNGKRSGSREYMRIESKRHTLD